MHQIGGHKLLNFASQIDANTIDVLGYNYGTGMNQLFARYFRAYNPTGTTIRTKETTKFYADSSTIPKPSTLLSDADLLNAAIASSSGFSTYSTNKPAMWNDTPFFAVTSTALNMADL